jgi:acetylornithine deacetylase/succinyl-diaminopimelate desuccinylase-like protein
MSEIKKILNDLIKIPSVSSDIEQLHKIVDYVENYFKSTNAIIERFEFNNKPSIVIKNFE